MSTELGDLLVSQGSLSEADLRAALTLQRGGDLSLPQALLKQGAVEEGVLYRALASQSGMPFVDLDKGSIRQEIIDRVPADMAAEQGILPVMEKDGDLVVAIDDPFKRIVADQLSFVIGGEIRCALAAPSALARALARYYDVGGEEHVAARMGSDGDDESDAPIIRLVTRMFADAIDERASDIHVEPGTVVCGFVTGWTACCAMWPSTPTTSRPL